MATITEKIQDMTFEKGTHFLGKIYFVKWAEAKDPNTGEVTAKISFVSDKFRDMFMAKIPRQNVTEELEKTLDKLDLFAPIELEKVATKHYAQTNGDYTGINLSVRAENVTILGKPGQSQQVGAGVNNSK